MTDNTNLIVRLPNWLGDVVMALPALQALHDVGFKLHLYGKNWILDLLATLPYELNCLTNSYFFNIKILRQDSTNQALLLTNSFSSAWLMYSAGKKIIGYKADFRDFLLHYGLNKSITLHEVEQFWRIAEFTAHINNKNQLWPVRIPNKITLPLKAVNQKQIDLLLGQYQINKPFIVLCPFALGKNKHGNTKIWPYWHELSKLLYDLNIVCIVCPNTNEERLCRQLVPYAYIMTGLNLSLLLALFARAKFVIANDTGPMHLAATQTQVLGIFGATDPKRTAPWGEKYIGSENSWPILHQAAQKLYDSF